MFKLTVLYGHPSDPAAFEQYYAETHMPLAVKIPMLTRIEAAKAQPGPDGSAAPYYRIAELWFASLEQLQASMGSAEGRAAVADLGNFATGGTTVFTSEVTAAQGQP